MRNQDRASVRRRLDEQLAPLRTSGRLMARPPDGWVRSIRNAMGMTAAQLGKRLGVSQQRALVIEKSENSGRITLASLARAAEALDCRLVYAIVPRSPLEKLVEDRAAMLARKQDVAEFDERAVRRLVMHAGSKLWDES
jgi:predicted DNA-binding mobile mystery protein A